MKAFARIWTSFRRSLFKFTQSRLSVMGIVILMVITASAIFASYLSPYPEDVEIIQPFERYQPPSESHLFGTDRLGRDVFSRVLFGGRVTLYVVVYVLAIAVTIGTVVGLVSGYIGGKLDVIIMGFVDAIMSLPALVMALTICVVLPRSLESSMLAVALAWWTRFARLVRGEAMHVKQETYVEAARSLGASKFQIMFKEILPNIATPIIVKMGLDAGWIVLTQAGLAFLGFGSTPPIPDWGTMIAWGRQDLPNYWWNATFPGFAIFMLVLAFCFIGDGLRDVYGE